MAFQGTAFRRLMLFATAGMSAGVTKAPDSF
jgi:hypothetical protein